MRQYVDKRLPPVSRIAILGNYPPRRCGIATFTADLTNSLLSGPTKPQVEVIAMSDGDRCDYPNVVRKEIQQQDVGAYARAIAWINDNSYDVLSVQHEYGIFGGESGRFLLNLLRESQVPIVTTLHTVLRNPSPSQRSILAEIIDLSARLIVMSDRAVEILNKEYAIQPEKLDVVPHGIPEFNPKMGGVLRGLLNISGPMILTFGLISPGKGIEDVIHAMPTIVASNPDAVYVLLGATHPHVKAKSGESYRQSLEALVESLGMTDHVRFVNEFVTIDELTAYLGAADIYISPYLDREQITSGTLAYAIGAGKCVISTPYPYAEELLSDGRGLLVPFGSPTAIAEAVSRISENLEESKKMADLASSYGAGMRWSEVARQTMDIFCQAASQRASVPGSTASKVQIRSNIPNIRFDHVLEMSSDTGIYQHATYTVPNRAEGYCVDDNARALILTAYVAEDQSLPRELARAQGQYLAFVCDALNPTNGRFRNFMDFSHTWLELAGSEDSHGRALWSLGTVVGRCTNESYRKVAYSVFVRASTAVANTTSPRTWAYSVLGAQEILQNNPLNEMAIRLRDSSSDRLLSQYLACRTEGWKWFEEKLTYGNARLCQALILAGKSRGNPRMASAGLESLTWLAERQTSHSGVFSPIGTESYFSKQSESLHLEPSTFDQQPLEAWASVSAYLTAYDVTSDPHWLKEADKAYGWFLGDNMPGIPLYDSLSGGCRDGLHADRPNENQGAESTLAFLCASLEMKHLAGLSLSQKALAL